MNCLIYLRVSTKEQAEGGYSIPAQREACAKFIEDKGWTLVDEYADRGESARTQDRPQFQEMLHCLKEDQSIDAVVVHKLDRLARNIEDHGAIRAILRKYKVQFVSVTENLEDTASGKLVEGILASIAEFFSANLSTEVKKGMQQKAKQGGWPGHAPVGYKNVRDDKGVAQIVISPEEAELVKEAFKLYATGEFSITEVAELMKEKGLRNHKTQKPLWRAKIDQLLKDKFYVGIITYKSVEYPGIHEPIITKELFFRVQEVFKLHDHAGERKRKHSHFLKGTIYCAECGSRMGTQLKTKPSGKTYNYFFCLGQSRKNGCKADYVLDKMIEVQIKRLYKKIEFSKDAVESLMADLERQLIEQEAFNINKEKQLTKKISELSEKRQLLMQAYYAQAIDVDILKEEQRRIVSDIELYEAQLQTTNIRTDQFKEMISLAMEMASNCYFLYTKAKPDDKRKLNQTFFKKILIANKKIKEVQFSELLDFIFELKSSSNATMVGATGFEPVASSVSGKRSPPELSAPSSNWLLVISS